MDEIASLWRGGCIIRAKFLSEIMRAYRSNPSLENLLLDSQIGDAVTTRALNWRELVSFGIQAGIPMLGFSSALAYFDSYRQERLPQNLTQAQRDFFGAHTFERTDLQGTFHSEWNS